MGILRRRTMTMMMFFDHTFYFVCLCLFRSSWFGCSLAQIFAFNIKGCLCTAWFGFALAKLRGWWVWPIKICAYLCADGKVWLVQWMWQWQIHFHVHEKGQTLSLMYSNKSKGSHTNYNHIFPYSPFASQLPFAQLNSSRGLLTHFTSLQICNVSSFQLFLRGVSGSDHSRRYH